MKISLSNHLATSDLNDLYKKIISRNNRLLFLTKMLAPEILIRNEKRLIQESVDALINNGKKGKIIVGTVRYVYKNSIFDKYDIK